MTDVGDNDNINIRVGLTAIFTGNIPHVSPPASRVFLVAASLYLFNNKDIFKNYVNYIFIPKTFGNRPT